MIWSEFYKQAIKLVLCTLSKVGHFCCCHGSTSKLPMSLPCQGSLSVSLSLSLFLSVALFMSLSVSLFFSRSQSVSLSLSVSLKHKTCSNIRTHCKNGQHVYNMLRIFPSVTLNRLYKKNIQTWGFKNVNM